jgi:hypothetical protein
MFRQKHDGTQYSANLEQHAQPNTPDIFSPNTDDLLNNDWFHPNLQKVPKIFLPFELTDIFTFLVSIGRLKEDDTSYYCTQYGFPRLLINFKKSPQLSTLEQQFNPEQALLRKSFFKKYKHHAGFSTFIKYLHVLNNIPVSEFNKNFFDVTNPVKTLFVKTLGDPLDYHNDVMAWAKCKSTLFAAAKRQIKSAPVPDPHVLQEFLQYAYNKIDTDIGYYLKNFGYSYKDWFNHLPSKKQQLIQPIHNYFHNKSQLDLTDTELKQLLSLDYEAICKTEIQDLDGKPRMVCAIPQLIKYTMGPVTWHLEEICEQHYQGYCGSMNLTQMAEKLNDYIDQGFTKVVEGDGSAFDNSQDIELKSLDRYIYNHIVDSIYHVPKQLFQQLSNLYYKSMNVKYSEYKHKRTLFNYYVLGTVFSGDCDTTLANTIRMATYNCFVNERVGLRYGEDFVVLSKGDDFSVLYKPYIPDEFIRQAYATCFLTKPQAPYDICDTRSYGIGQICKFLDIGKPDSFKFCSLRSWYIDDDYHITLTRDPAKLYSHAQYSIKAKCYSPAEMMQYHLDLYTSYRINYPGLDIFQIMACAHLQQYYKLAKHFNATLKPRTSQLVRNNTAPINLSTTLMRESLLQGVTDDDFSDWYHIHHKQQQVKITNDYWSTMKKLERARFDKLNSRQLAMVNQQINTEFDLDALRVMLALSKNYLSDIKIIDEYNKEN